MLCGIRLQVPSQAWCTKNFRSSAPAIFSSPICLEIQQTRYSSVCRQIIFQYDSVCRHKTAASPQLHGALLLGG